MEVGKSISYKYGEGSTEPWVVSRIGVLQDNPWRDDAEVAALLDLVREPLSKEVVEWRFTDFPERLVAASLTVPSEWPDVLDVVTVARVLDDEAHPFEFPLSFASILTIGSSRGVSPRCPGIQSGCEIHWAVTWPLTVKKSLLVERRV